MLLQFGGTTKQNYHLFHVQQRLFVYGSVFISLQCRPSCLRKRSFWHTCLFLMIYVCTFLLILYTCKIVCTPCFTHFSNFPSFLLPVFSFFYFTVPVSCLYVVSLIVFSCTNNTLAHLQQITLFECSVLIIEQSNRKSFM